MKLRCLHFQREWQRILGFLKVCIISPWLCTFEKFCCVEIQAKTPQSTLDWSAEVVGAEGEVQGEGRGRL